MMSKNVKGNRENSGKDVVIVAASRTAIGRFQGGLATIRAPELGATVIRRLLQDLKLDPAEVDEVIMGQVLTAGEGQNAARQAALSAGLPHSVPATTINKVCGSGMKSLHLGIQAILCGDADTIIAGGQENMSLAPYLLPKVRTGLKMGHAQMVDSMIQDGLWDAFYDYHMGQTAENLAEKFDIHREAQDQYPTKRRAPLSHRVASMMKSHRYQSPSARAILLP